jgi:hypothetical protein
VYMCKGVVREYMCPGVVQDTVLWEYCRITGDVTGTGPVYWCRSSTAIQCCRSSTGVLLYRCITSIQVYRSITEVQVYWTS